MFDELTRPPEVEQPLISPTAAAALSVLFTLLYVLPFYLSKKTRPSPQLSRDAPSVIRARIRAVTGSCIVASLITVHVAVHHAHLSYRDVAHALGWWPLAPLDILRSLALVAVLFVGPLFEAAVCEGRWRDWIRPAHLRESLGSWMGWRNYVAGPITEEIVFRSLLVPLHTFAKLSPPKLVFLTPLYFGIAHVHHFSEFRLTHPKQPMMFAIMVTVLQFSYTSLFGFYASFLFLRTGSLPAAIAAHAFCNWMGLPRFWGRVEAPVAIGSQDVKLREQAASSASTAQIADGRLSIGWTIAYYVLLATGAYGFYHYLWILTESPNALVSF